MKKILLFVLLIITTHLYPQDTDNDSLKIWNFGGVVTITTSQVSLSHWAAGGDNSMSLNSLANLFADFNKNKHSWANKFDASFGTQKIGKNDFEKSDDKFDFSSKYGYETINNWYISALYNVNSQFHYGYKTLEDGTKQKTSGFLSPTYMIYSTGMDYKPNEHFALYTSPLTGKSTFIKDTTIAKPENYGLEANMNSRFEFGAYIKIEYKKEIVENVTLDTKIDLFSNYLKNPKNVDVTWNMLINMKVNKFLTVNLNTSLIYDDDIKIFDKELNREAPFIQFKEVFGVGLSFAF